MMEIDNMIVSATIYSDKIADQKCVPFVYLKYISAVA